jgi:hypothetical protein
MFTLEAGNGVYFFQETFMTAIHSFIFHWGFIDLDILSYLLFGQGIFASWFAMLPLMLYKYIQELESNLASKQASLPSEPPPDSEGAVTIVVRMPDGSRQGRRFLKSDKLQVKTLGYWNPEQKHSLDWLLFSFSVYGGDINTCFVFLVCLQFLFDFIDVGRTCKPGSYRLVIILYCYFYISPHLKKGDSVSLVFT